VGTIVRPQTIELHGQPVTYLQSGEGPPLVLIHGITSRASSWEQVIPGLAERHTVIAPDLMGHGGSAKPRGDYSLGSHASGVRDLLIALGHSRVTVVGHSLGGGIAMQLAYQFPERVERLVLVSSGGLGREVGMLLRAATLPGAELVLPLVTGRGVNNAGAFVGRALGKVGLRPSPYIQGMAEGFASLGEPDARRAFLHTVRSIADPSGQRVDARDRLYLAEAMPVLVVWGGKDRMIPVAHGQAAAKAMPHSRLEVFDRAGHFPFNDEPARFVQLLHDFVATTEPAIFDEDHVRRMLLGERM
jgi:pimeloyl-ACP methyl ester carboxylesterase